MTGCIAQRKDIYYVRLTYYDKNHQRKEKWVSTGLSGRGAKQKATAMIQSLIDKYSYYNILLVLNQCKSINKPVLKETFANIVLILLKRGSQKAQNAT